MLWERNFYDVFLWNILHAKASFWFIIFYTKVDETKALNNHIYDPYFDIFGKETFFSSELESGNG